MIYPSPTEDNDVSSRPNGNDAENIHRGDISLKGDDLNKLLIKCYDGSTHLPSVNQIQVQPQSSQGYNHIQSIFDSEKENEQQYAYEKPASAKTISNELSNGRRFSSSLKRSASTVSDIQFMRRGNLRELTNYQNVTLLTVTV